jgi:hypothetical protein
VSRKKEVDLCLPREGIRQEVELKLKEPSTYCQEFQWDGAPVFYWREHQGCPGFSLETTNAFVAMVSNSSF